MIVNSIIFIISTLVVSCAVFTQYYWDLYPCTYCILARLMFSAIAIVSFVSIIAQLILNKQTKNITNLNLFISSAFSFAGLYLSYQHFLVVKANEFTCGIDKLQDKINSLPTASYLPYVYEATGNCVDANYKIFGFFDYIWLPPICYALILLTVLIYLLTSRKYNRLS